MSVLATIAVPTSAFPLGSTFERDPELTLSAETTVPTSEAVIPYLWVPADLSASLLDALADDPAVAAATVLDEVDRHALVSLEWTDGVDGVVRAIQETGAIVTGAAGTADRWTFRLRFPDYEDLSAFYDRCVDRDLSVDLVQVREVHTASDGRQFGLTAAQRDLLLAAYEAGYFEVPRRATLVDLGERLEVSDSAVSQRLRRGLAALLEATIAADPHSREGDAAHAHLDRRSVGAGPDR